MTWHNTSHHIASNDVTITWPDPGTDIKTSKHFTTKHKTSPPWKGRRLVHSKEMIWASRWSVTMRTFYRQILSVLYSSFPFGNFRPRLVRALLVYYMYIICTSKLCSFCRSKKKSDVVSFRYSNLDMNKHIQLSPTNKKIPINLSMNILLVWFDLPQLLVSFQFLHCASTIANKMRQ